ncbi:MAG: 30S ribosome-binding factor RbfA [Candidatus Krumholzibacteriales bacterium]
MKDKYKARMEEQLARFIAELFLRKLKDPRIANVTVQKVKAADDFSVAKVYYNMIGDDNELEEVKRGLDSCKSFIWNEVKNHFRLRKIPELIFVYDVSLDRAMKIENIIDEIHKESGEEGEEGDG